MVVVVVLFVVVDIVHHAKAHSVLVLVLVALALQTGCALVVASAGSECNLIYDINSDANYEKK